jgi:colanic acid/amylovoran biosynthesis glycosyltransferase
MLHPEETTQQADTRPTVASYCTTFLKPEMRHIYRQVTGLRRYKTFILTRERSSETQFPFDAVEQIPRAKKNFVARFWLKYVRRLPPVYYRGELQEVLKVLHRRPADLLHVYFGHTGVHLLPLISEWDRPSVVSFHGMDIQPRPDQHGYDTQMQQLLQSVPLVLARSHSLAARLADLGCPREKIRINRTGIPLEEFPFQPRSTPPDGAWQLVQACRLIEKKGLLTALRAFAQFHREHPRSRFVIAGEGPLKSQLQKWIAELALQNSVELRGFLSQQDLAALYAQSHLFIHPSEMPPDQNQEGIPNSMLEAMATGLPVLATLHGGIPEAVTHSVTGLLVAERDHEALADALKRITSSPQIFSSMGSAAAQSVRSEFEQSKAVQNLENFYDEARALFRPCALEKKRGSA